VKVTREVIANTLEKKQLKPQTRQELLNWRHTITKQNYFSKNGKILIQQDGLAMGPPTSGIIAESFFRT
jgi:hypothetical protein